MLPAIKNIIFIDIETATGVYSYDHLSPDLQKEWNRKAMYLKGHEDVAHRSSLLFKEKAGIYAEFGKVVCVGLGALMQEGGTWKLALKSIAEDNEHLLLEQLLKALQSFGQGKREIIFCGHNIKEFDLPYLCRRMMIHGLLLPEALQLSNKKPWEIKHQDTLELWRFGDYKHYITLSLLAQCLGVPSPKDDIDGSMVSDVYWNEKDLSRIATYCLKDVATTARVFLKLSGQSIPNFEEKYL